MAPWRQFYNAANNGAPMLMLQKYVDAGEERCHVRNCSYIAEHMIEDFPVCALHNHKNVRRILETLRCPCYFWFCGKPCVSGDVPLVAKDFEHKKLTARSVHAQDDPVFESVSPHRNFMVSENVDLTI